MKIQSIMSTRVISVNMDDTLRHVRALFENHNFHHLMVVEKNKLVGILSDRDLLKAISPHLDTASETVKDSACLNKRVHQIMTRDAVTLTPECGLFKAIQMFNEYSLSCIPIVDSDDKPVGVLSWRDIFRFIETNQLEKHLSQSP